MDIVVFTESKKKGKGVKIIDAYMHVLSGVPKDQRQY